MLRQVWRPIDMSLVCISFGDLSIAGGVQTVVIMLTQ